MAVAARPAGAFGCAGAVGARAGDPAAAHGGGDDAHANAPARGNKRAAKWDRELSEARFSFDWRRQFELSLDPETAEAMHDETLSDDYFKSAEFCSMCGPKYCPMHNFKDIDWDAIRTVVAERKRYRLPA